MKTGPIKSFSEIAKLEVVMFQGTTAIMRGPSGRKFYTDSGFISPKVSSLSWPTEDDQQKVNKCIESNISTEMVATHSQYKAAYVPYDDWQNNLVKTRDYAVNVVGRTMLDQYTEEGTLKWNDKNSIQAVIKRFENGDYPSKEKPSQKVDFMDTLHYENEAWGDFIHLGNKSDDITPDSFSKTVRKHATELIQIKTALQQFAEHARNTYEPTVTWEVKPVIYPGGLRLAYRLIFTPPKSLPLPYLMAELAFNTERIAEYANARRVIDGDGKRELEKYNHYDDPKYGVDRNATVRISFEKNAITYDKLLSFAYDMRMNLDPLTEYVKTESTNKATESTNRKRAQAKAKAAMVMIRALKS